jgi:hypothetical protein
VSRCLGVPAVRPAKNFEGKVMAMVQLSAYGFKDSAIQPYISSVSSAKCTSDSDFRAGFW